MMGLLRTFFIVAAAAALGHAAPPHPQGPTPFANVTVFVPPANYTDPQVLYARTVELADGTLLATWENYSPEPPPVYFPIFRSTDYGHTWTKISEIHDQVFGYGLRYQPFLYLLPEPIGGFPAGTILAAGNCIPTNLSSTHIELYASRDNGLTWAFVSHIASGGEAVPDNGLTPIWEPFLLLYQGRLITFYSDQRQNATYGQKLVHQTSADLRTWGPVVNDVTYPVYTDRPGMTTVAELPNGKWIMTYEFGGGPVEGVPNTTYSFPVFFRISDSPETFEEATGHPVITAEGLQPQSSPYVVWTPAGGCNGMIVVSSGTHSQVFVNKNLGEGYWEEVDTPEGISYTRHLRVFQENPDMLLLMGAGHLPPSTTNKVTVSVMNIAQAAG